MSDRIPLGVIGISHHTAAVEVREKVALSEIEQSVAIKYFSGRTDVDGCMVLSTCNRTEIYVSGHQFDSAIDQIKPWLNELKSCVEYTDLSIFYQKKGIEAAEHFCKVIAGVDSLILGEQQITGQVKDSYEMAHSLKGTDTLINKLFNFAMQAKKKVHNETFLSDGTVSVSFAGVELARKIFSDLSDKKILLIGVGKTAELAAFHFQENGVKHINVANRTLENATELAGKLNGKAYQLDNLAEVLEETDIVISATASETYVVTEELIQQISKIRHHRPLFLIDLAIPRDIDPEVANINGVFLYNLDDLQDIVKSNLEKRKKEIPKAMKIIEEYVGEFQQWVSMNSMNSIVGMLKSKLNVLRLNELERLKSKLPLNGYKSEIENLTESIINKVVRQHVKSLKKVAHDPEQYRQQVEIILRIYELDEEN